MGVRLRLRKLSNGRSRYYLDFYPKIPHPETGELKRREILKLFKYDNPKDTLEREHNKTTKLQAETICAKRLLSIQEGHYGFLSKSNGSKNFVEYFRDLANTKKTSKGNSDNWISAFKYFDAFVKGHCSMENVTSKLCSEFREHLLSTRSRGNHKTVKTLSQNAAHSYFNKFRTAIKQALEDGLLKKNPLTKVKSIKPAETHREFLTQEELMKLVETDCDPAMLKQMALFSAFTGLRWSDIVSLKWSDVRMGNSDTFEIQFTQKKTKGAEVLPISKDALSFLGTPKNTNDLVFPNIEYSGWITQKLKIWLLQAGITKKITFHCFRHTYATLQLAFGTDINTIRDLLGHKNLKTTQIYAKVMDQKKIEAANKMRIT